MESIEEKMHVDFGDKKVNYRPSSGKLDEQST